MATTSLEAIRRIVIEAQAKGLDDVAAKLDKVARAQEGVVASSEKVEKSSSGVETAFKREQRSLDVNQRAYEQYARSVKAVSDAQAQGLTSNQRATELLGLAEARLKKATGATEEFGKAAGPARHEWVNLSRQLQDVAVSLQGGMSPLTVLGQQGSQISDVFISSKASVGSFFTTAMTGAKNLLVTWGPLAAAVGTVAGGIALAMRSMEQEREARIATSSGLGRFAGASSADVGAAAGRSRAAGVSLDESREGVLTGLRAGGPSLAIIEQANAIAKQYAMTLQMELVPAQKELMAAFADPGKGAEALEQKLKFLDGSTKDYIKTLQANGETAKAAQVLMDALRNSMALTTEPVGAAETAWARFKTTITQIADVLGQVAMASPRAVAAVNQIGDGPLGGGARRGSTGAQGRLIREQMGAGSAATLSAVPPGTLEALAAEEQGLRQVYNALEPLRQTQLAAADAIEKLNTAFANDVAVMNATTVEARALATQQQVMNDLSDKNVNSEEAYARALLAGNRIREQAAATSRQRVADQEIEIEINSRMIGAYQNQTGALDSVIARLKEEQSIRQAGLDVTTAENQKRIENAGRIADQTKALEALKSAQQGSMATTYNPNAAGGYEMSSGSGISDRTSRYNDKLERIQDQMGRSADYAMRAMDGWRDAVNSAADGTYSLGTAARKASDSLGVLSSEAASAPFAAGGDKPMSQRGGFTSDIITWDFWQQRMAKNRAGQQKVGEQIAQAERQGEQTRIGYAKETIQEQISALQEQRSALDENTSAIEKATDEQRKQLDKTIAKLEKALSPSRPDPYAERNPDYFYRFGTQAFKENDPLQKQLAEAEAQRDALDAQLDQQKKAVELQQKAIDEQIKGYEMQAQELDRASRLLSAGVELSAQEVAGIQGIIAAISGLGDYSRMAAASQVQTGNQIGEIQSQAPAPEWAGMGSTQKAIATHGFGGYAYTGRFASGGYIPKGAWGIAGEAGPELISKARAVAGPAKVTPINGQPIVVNQTIVSQGGMRELRASRGELAQRSASEMRRSLRTAQ
jgi:hypothetical protein